MAQFSAHTAAGARLSSTQQCRGVQSVRGGALPAMQRQLRQIQENSRSSPFAAPHSSSLQGSSSNSSTVCRVASFEGVQTHTSSPLAEPQHKYLLGELLGSGTAARVVVGTDQATQAQYAVKILPKQRGAKNRTEQIKQEIAISKRLQHCRHAVKTVDSFEDGRNIYVVQELCCGGDLADLMSAQEGQLSEQEAASIIKCVLEFLADCHERSICYGDVKPNNFVLRSLYPCIAHLMDPRKPRGNLEVVAVDFGCCQEVDRENCLPDTKVTGTPLYMAPENMRGCHGVEVDVWAAGVMLYQLLSDRFPFWDVSLEQMDGLGGSAIREGIMHGPVLFPLQPWAISVHPSAQDLIVRMLDRNVERRITAAEALQHPWFAEVLGQQQQQ